MMVQVHAISECCKFQNKKRLNGTYKSNGNKEVENSANLAPDDSFDDGVLVITVGCAETNDDRVFGIAWSFHVSTWRLGYYL